MLKDFFNPKNDDPEESQGIRDWANYLGLGIQLAITVIAMTFLGIWLDKKYNSGPWLTVICSMFGIFGAIYNFIKSVLKSGK